MNTTIIVRTFVEENVCFRFRPRIGFPGVMGCIDCTHVAITTPYVNEEGYKNHHGYYSINVQAVSVSRYSLQVCVCMLLFVTGL